MPLSIRNDSLEGMSRLIPLGVMASDWTHFLVILIGQGQKQLRSHEGDVFFSVETQFAPRFKSFQDVPTIPIIPRGSSESLKT